MRTRTLLSILLLLTLTGCDGLGPTQDTMSPTPPPSPIPPTATPSPTQEPQPMIVTLKLWLPEELDPYGENPGADVLAQQLVDFGRAYADLQVEVTVKKDGTVGKAAIKQGIEDYPSMGKSALAAVRQWRFEPATKDREPVDLSIVVPVSFTLCDKQKKE